MAKVADIPKEIADNWDKIVETFHGRLVEQRKEFKKRTGTRPFKGESVSQSDKMIQIGSLSAEDWGQVFQKHGIIKEDGRILLPNDMIKQAKELNKTMHRGEIKV